MDYFTFASQNARSEFKGATTMKTTRETHYFVGGSWVPSSAVSQDAAARANFAICCQYGDWSGFRTLDACLAQSPSTGRPDYFYWIEER